MDMTAQIEREIHESLMVRAALAPGCVAQIAEIAHIVAERLRAGNQLLVFGNGGSAADAQHMVAELVGRYRAERPPLAAIALTANTSILTAIGNDYGYDQVFARQILALGHAGDVALAISTSGNSPNVLRALEAATQRGLLTIGLTGKTGGKMLERASLCLCVPCDSTPRIQEAHLLIIHIVCGMIERVFLQDLDLASTRASAVSK